MNLTDTFVLTNEVLGFFWGLIRQSGQNTTSVRTDFHAEPIANVIMQMEGKKVRLLHFSVAYLRLF